MMKVWLLVCMLQLMTQINADGMIEVFKWKQIDFYNRGDGANLQPDSDQVYFPGPSVRYSGHKKSLQTDRITSYGQQNKIVTKENKVETASYIPYNNVPIGVNHYNGRLFVTTPRRRNGIPSTLNYIDLHADGHMTSPKWRAYPDFHLNQFNESREGIVSVYRTKVDACKRLWFIDTGMLEYPNDRQQLKRPSLWIMDLTTDRKIRRTEIPEHIVATGNGLASLSVDVEASDCGKAFAYIPDLSNRQLHVYSYESGRIWTFKHDYFNVDPASGDLVVGGQTFRWNDGIFSTTLGPRRLDGSCDVYFHPMASNNEFVVSNRVLQLESNAARSDHGNDFRLLGSRGVKKQSTMHVCDHNTGVIFYDEIQRNGIGCWNTNRTFSAEHHGTVIEDERMIYPSDLTLDNEGNIWVMSNSMPIFVYSKLDPNEYNFRVWKRNVIDAKRHTICE